MSLGFHITLQPIHGRGTAYDLSLRYKGVDLLPPSTAYEAWEISSNDICLYGIMMASSPALMFNLRDVIMKKCPDAPVLLDSPPGLKVTFDLALHPHASGPLSIGGVDPDLDPLVNP